MRGVHGLICGVAACAMVGFTVLPAGRARGGQGDPAVPSTGPASDPARADPPVTRAYDVRELTLLVPDFDAAPSLTAPPGPPPPATRPAADPAARDSIDSVGHGSDLPTREDLAKSIAEYVMESVDSDSWRDNGGDVGTIRYRDGFLFVRQTPANHAKVRDALAALQQTRAKPVRIRAHWVQTRRRALDTILKPADGKPGGTVLAADPDALERLPDGAVHYRGEILCMEGQRVFLTSAAVPDGGAGGGAAASSGLLLDVVNTINADRTAAVLTLRSETAPARPPGQDRPATTRPARSPAASTLQSFSTTVRVPLGRAVLVGGITVGPPADPSPPDLDPPQLYLFVEVTAE